MDGAKRRDEIVRQLRQSQKPISASRFAQQFSISRQIVVGDIALLRAAGVNILATARGYKMEREDSFFETQVVVQHSEERTREELELIVSLGGEIVNVIVEHDLYGDLVGGLHIRDQKDIASFMKKYEQSNARLLSQLTEGIHIHTIRYQSEDVFEKIKQALKERNFLYEN